MYPSIQKNDVSKCIKVPALRNMLRRQEAVAHFIIGILVK